MLNVPGYSISNKLYDLSSNSLTKSSDPLTINGTDKPRVAR